MTEGKTRQVTAAPDIDPDIRRFVDTVAADLARYPDAEGLPYPELRRVLESVRARWAQGGPRMAASEEIHAPTRYGPVRVRIYWPDTGTTQPVLVYLHGGGWTFFSLDTHDRLMREYAARAGVVVAGVDFALSPEAKFPIALGQTIDVLRWLGETGARLGIDTTRISVGGDSAGANLSVAACLALRDAGLDSLVRAMVLNYGAFDAQCEGTAGSPYGGPGYMLGYEEMQTYWRNYVRSNDDYRLPLVSPLRAELAGLPPALLVIPECDVLSVQSHALAAKLRQAQVRVCARVYEGATHSFLEAVSIAAVSDLALSDTADWLREFLADDKQASR